MLITLISFLIKTVISLVLLYCMLTIAILGYIKLKLEPVKALCKSNARIDDKIVLVTGVNQGIGLETARDLASRGAKVIIACRDREKSAEAIIDIIRTTGNKKIEYQYLDLASFSCVRKFVENFNQTYDRLDILINNAGCGGLKHKATEDGIDVVMQVNYLGPFLLTNLLLDKIKASPAGRIVIVSSCLHFFGRLTTDQLNGLHTRSWLYKYANSKLCEVLWTKLLTNLLLDKIKASPAGRIVIVSSCLHFFGRWTTDQLNGLHTRSWLYKYANSKLCEVLWTKALAIRLPNHVTVNSLHPGVVKTNIFKRYPPNIQKWLMFWIYVFNFKTPKEGAQTTIHLAVSEEVANVSGKYFMECKEADYSKIADNDEYVEKIWNKSSMLTSQPIECMSRSLLRRLW